MHTFRGSLANIPSAISNFISNTTTSPIEGASSITISSGPMASTDNNSSSTDDNSDKSHAIPTTLIKEQWQLILDHDASIDDLNNAIVRCKELVIKTDECSDERKWLVRHLVELRFRIQEIEDTVNDPNKLGSNVKVILGHHFIARISKTTPKTRQYCDHCTGVIWSVVQASYICIDCGFCVHHKCIESVVRVCAHIITSERKEPYNDICPETGLAFQAYKCTECQTSLSFNFPGWFYCLGIHSKAEGGWVEPRICDYTGLYYCPTCHWNNVSPIPARILHNWDFTPYKICRASLQELNLMHERSVIDLEERNPKLFIYVQNLSLVKKLRTNLNDMRRYLCECRIAIASKLLENTIGSKRHLVQCVNMYSISDLVGVENGTLPEFLNKSFAIFDQHIRKCQLCAGKGYVCEICSNVEVIFPYDDGAIHCKDCKTVLHRACWLRKNQKCPRCVRLEYRRSLLPATPTDDDVGNNNANSGGSDDGVKES